jgi:hypothetical protein
MLAALLALMAVASLQANSPLPSPPAPADETSTYPRLPLSFVPNQGQADARALYSAQAGGASLHFTRDRVAITLEGKDKAHALHLRFLGANPSPTLTGEDRQKGRVNYFTANASQTNIPTYGELRYRNLWPGIDLAFRGEGGTLKYEFHVAPGADPSDIRLAYAGAESLSLGAAGALLIETPLGTVRDQAPRSYQRSGRRRVAVESAYSTTGNRYGFELGAYERTKPLVIDPGLVYSTFLGGTQTDATAGIVVDDAENAYVSGYTQSSDFPTTPGAHDTTVSQTDVFIAKLNPSATGFVYATYLGGSAAESPSGIDIDSAGNVYVSGTTDSPDFPTTPGAFDGALGTFYDLDGFVTKLNTDGSALGYSTYLGGEEIDQARGIAVDNGGNAYVTGSSYGDYPLTPGAPDATPAGASGDAVVTKLNASGTALEYSTFLGGNGEDWTGGIAVDADGSAYVAGETTSSDFPVTLEAFDTGLSGVEDTFLTKVNPAGTAFTYSTYLGGSGDERGASLAVDSDGNAYVSGKTGSSPDFPTTPGAYDRVVSDRNRFLTKFNSTGSGLIYSTFLKTGAQSWSALEVDSQGNAYLAGTSWGGTPTTPGAYDRTFFTSGSGGMPDDAFLTKFNPTGSVLEYSTYLGTDDDAAVSVADLALDADNDVYLAGSTSSPYFPTTPGVLDTTVSGSDGFVAKFELPDVGHIVVVQDTIADDPQDFPFSASAFDPSSFVLDDDSDPVRTNTKLLDGAPAGTYSVTQTGPSGPVVWYLGDLRCSDGSNPSAINLSAGETVTCRFTNSRLYPRPSGATPLRVALVPAYRLCGSAANPQNSNHVEPLDLDSCSPPLQASNTLTLSNQGKGQGSARFDVIVGDPGTPGDQADVAVRASATDVRETAGGGDYAGQVLLASVIRVTDKGNGPYGGGAATTENFEMSLPVDCTPTADTNTGSTCALNSTLDSLVPGLAWEGRRGMFSLLTMRIKDAGADGSITPPAGGLGCPPECGSGDERTFLDQGLFLP